MELFVINRHDEEPSEVSQNEQEKLDKVLKKIQRNKKIRQKQKEKYSEIKNAIKRTVQTREHKRKIKSSIVNVPENNNDEFIDKDIINSVTVDNTNATDENISKKLKLDVDTLEGFTVLGADNLVNRTKVKRVLPAWLSNPSVISVDLQDLQVKVSDMKELDKGIRKLLKANNIRHFFPVQAEVIPWLLETSRHSDVIFPRDICVSAPTGSGKTLAYVLPIVQALKKYTVKKIRALIILPTQDLATQVFKSFKFYCQNTNIEVCVITGNNSFSVEQTQLIIENKAFGYMSKIDILVCTAGRLVDHIKVTKGFNLRNLEFLVIDEADRVLENIQNDWLYHLEKHIYEDESNTNSRKILNLQSLEQPRPPQKLLFSATLSQDPEKLQKLALFQPKLFTSVVETDGQENLSKNTIVDTFVGKYTTPKELKEKYIVTTAELKPLFLYKLIKLKKLTKSIVFTHSAESAHRLSILLRALFKEELKVEEISSHLQGKNRTKLIEKFSTGNIDLLVCTDALARGIDLPQIQCVISYSSPKYLKTYIHRAGRTARAGEMGLAVTLLNKPQVTKFKAMLSQAKHTTIEELVIPEDNLEPLGENYKESLEQLKRIVEKEEKMDLEKALSTKRTKNNKPNRKRKESINSNISM